MSISAVPRPEYPRPQFERSDWTNLNGPWEFAFDDAEQGLQLGWQDGRQFDKQIIVPFPYQSELSGINDKGIHEVVWYAKSLDWDEAWANSDVLLHFGAVDYFTTVWVNGLETGSNRGGHVPFSFDIAPYLKKGSNRITLRVEDRKDPGQPRGKQSSTGLPHGIDYYCTTGVWQTVWIEPVPTIRIDHLRITPIVKEEGFELRIFLHAPSADYVFEADVLDNGVIVAEAQKRVCSATSRMFIRIPNAKFWSPENPHLYDLEVRVHKGDQLLDKVKSYVGLRQIELSRGRLYLNGKPLFLIMTLDQGYWPKSYLAAPSDDALRADVEWAKRFGYNGVRKHQKIEDPRWLYWCDKLGIFVWGEMPNARAWSPRTEEMLLAEWSRAVERDFNHPCIIAWVPVNESMGFPDLEIGHPGQYAFVERMVAVTRRLDPERPVIDNDGWEHTDVSDIVAIHDYSSDAAKLIERYRATISGGPLPVNTWLPNKPVFTHGSQYHGQPIMFTEVGGFLFKPEGIAEEDLDVLYTGYGSINRFDELLGRYCDLMEGIAALPFISGFCYTQLTDVEQEMNGLLTYDRQPKVPPEEIASIHAKLFSGKTVDGG